MRSLRFKVRSLMLVTVVAAIGLSLWFAPSNVAVWDGRFPLQVTLEHQTGRPIAGVAVQTVARIADSQFLCANPESPELELDDVHWVPGEAFTIQVRCGGRSSLQGRELSYSQLDGIVLRVTYTDGTSQLISAKIPDGRRQRQLTVHVPN